MEAFDLYRNNGGAVNYHPAIETVRKPTLLFKGAHSSEYNHRTHDQSADGISHFGCNNGKWKETAQ